MSAPGSDEILSVDVVRLQAAASALRASTHPSRGLYGHAGQVVTADVAARIADWLDAEAFLLNGIEPFVEMFAVTLEQVSGGKASLALGRDEDGGIAMRAQSSDQALRLASAILGEG